MIFDTTVVRHDGARYHNEATMPVLTLSITQAYIDYTFYVLVKR